MNKKNILFVITLFSVSLTFAQTPALNFDGEDDYVQTTYMGIQGSADRTIEAWIKTSAITDPNSGGIQHVILDYGTFNTGERFTFNVLWNNAIRLEVGGNGVSGTIPVNDGVWHHVAVVYFEEGNMVQLYVDGELDTEGTLTVPTNTTNLYTVVLGRRIDDTRYFRGEIDEVRFYNFAKTQAEIMEDMSSELCENPDGLVAYWKLNEGLPNANNSANNTILDYSINANGGELLNFALMGNTSNWVQGSLTSNITSSNETINACDSAMVNGEWYFESQILLDTAINAAGCDSIIQTELLISSNDISLTVDSITISSNEPDAEAYSWYDCINNMVIPGEIEPSFTPAISGEYAVILFQEGCIDTSDCVPITITSFGAVGIALNSLEIFPNPNQGEFLVNLEAKTTETAFRYAIYDFLGKKQSSQAINSNTFKVVHTNLPKGVYFILVETPTSNFLQKFIIQ